jgi:hypothetical protein
VSAASSSNNSGRTYIQDILLDSFGHITGITTATETVTDTNNFTTGATFNTGNGEITFTKNDGTTYTVDLDGRYGSSSSDYYTTGATFNTSDGVVTFTRNDGGTYTVDLDGRFLTAHPSVSAASSSDNSGRTYIQDILLDSFGHITGITTATETVVDTYTTGVTTNGTTGLITFTKNDGGTYATSISGYVTTQIANLIDSAPTTLDTLNELAAALGDDPNFATSIATSIGNKVSKSGDTMTGNLSIFKNNTTLTLGQINVSTGFTTIEMYAGGGGAFNGYSIRYNKDTSFDRLEFVDGGGIATVYFENGGFVNANQFRKVGGTSSQFLKADGSVDSNTYLTAHPSVSAASSSNNSGRTYIQDILLDSFGHITGITTGTETVTDTNTFITGATFNTGDGVVTITKNDGNTVTVDLDGRYQLSGSYLTGYTETDTLATVTARGNTTNQAITVSGVTSYNDVVISGGTLTVYESVSGATVFAVDGTNGRLFAVTDDLSNSLFSVSTISGLPVIEAFADYHIVMGRFNQNDFYLGTTGEIGMGSLPVSGYKLAVTGNVRATSFVKSGGTSSQFLKADGSVDTNTYLTAHPSVSAASSSDNSGRTYIQDILLDSFGHITGITTGTETVVNTDTDTNYYTTGVTFNTGDGVLTFTRTDGGTYTVDLDGRYGSSSSDYYTTGATFNTSTGVITLTRNDGGTYTVDIDGKYLDSSSYTASDVLSKLLTVDGSGSTLDADLLDGQHGSYYYPASNPSGFTSNVGTVTSVAALTIGTSGTDVTSTVTNGTTTPVITLNIPDASDTARGLISTSGQNIAGTKTFTTAGRTTFSNNDFLQAIFQNGASTMQIGSASNIARITSNGSISLITNYPTNSNPSLYINSNGRSLFNTTTDNNVDTVQINGSVIATSIKKSGGTSSQFLMADGSTSTNPGWITSYTDTNYYVTGATFNTSTGVITMTRNDGGTVTVDIDGKYSELGHTHDDRYLPYVKNVETLGLVSGRWYTIAVNVGNRAVGKFILRDTSSGNHQSVVFYATHHFGSYSDITVLINSRYSGNPFRYIRIQDGGTYDGALLQVYIDQSSSTVQAWMLENIQSSGWVIKDWVDEAVDPGDVTNFSALTTTPAQVDLDQTPQGGLIVTGPIYGGGDTTQYEYLNTNNYSTTTDTRYYTETEIANFFGGSVAITGYNKSNWDTAYGWGNHGTQGYATTGYVQTQISNLIDSAPGTLDTLNELAAAINDDPNFYATITGITNNKVSKSGDTMTGNLSFGATSNLGLTWGLNTDAAFIKFISTSNSAGGSYLEIGTQDDSDEEIKFTQSGNVRFYLATDGFLRNGAGYKYVFENGTWGINISGNAATVTNGVYDNGSYSNPAWITALAGSKITGNISGNAYNITQYTINQDLGTGNSVSFNAVTSPVYYTTASSTRNKIILWGTDTNYVIGMESAVVFGGLNDYAMTFQMNNEDDRGFWWGDATHSTSQGAMALTTNGYLTVARGVRVGYGESDTTTPSVPLQVYGSGSLVFDVQGSQGQLFSVTDSLSGSLFSVNDISGLPILEVFSDDKLVAGSFGTNAFVVSGTTTTVSGSLAVSGSATVNGGTVWHSGNDGSGSGLDADTLDGLHASSFLTAHPSVSAAGSSNNSGRTYIQDILLDSFGHITGITTATETVVDTDTNYYVTGATFNTSDGVVTLTRNDGGTITVDLDGRYGSSSSDYYTTGATFNTGNGIITFTRNDGGTYTVDIDGKYLDSSSYTASDVLSKLLTVDGSGSGLDADTLDGYHASSFLTSYSETDTLNSVTTRGASTTNDITIGGLTVGGSLTYGTYTSASNYVLGADNILLKGNSGGVSGIFFESEKNGTNINHPSDFGFIQYHAYGVGGSSGESNRLVIGVSNDADDVIVLNPVNANGLVVRVGAGTTEYTVYHAGNIPTWNQNTSGNAATATYATTAGALSSMNISQFTNNSGYLTAHPTISAASSVNNSGRTYIQDITLDSNGHITGIVSATETVTDTDTNYYVTGATFNTSTGVITMTRNDGGTVTVDIDGKYQESGTYLGAISYNNNSNANYQLLWGSGNAVYGTAEVYVNPSTDYVYAASFNASDWFRSSGNTGWYNSTHGGGIYQTESTMVRTYDNRGLWIDGGNNNMVQDATLYVTATNNNDWLAIFNAYNSSKSEYGLYVNIASSATYGYALRTDGSSFTYRVDGSGRVYAPIYYDINDTNYYVNPASTSNLSTVKLNSTASGTEVFTIDGVNGRLFTITDDLSNSLFSVNTIAGVPVVEVFADNKVIMGRYNQNDLHISSTGEIGMGNTSVSGFKLAVTGNLRATSFVRTGGSSSQFLMADGSVSTNPGWITSYSETDTLDSVLARGASTTRTAEFYQTSNTFINTVTATNRGLTVYQNTAGADAYMTFHISGDYAGYFGLGGAENDLVWGGWSLGNVRNRIWHSGNDGSGSGLDADTLDGLHASSFLTSYSETDTLASVTSRGASTSTAITLSGGSGTTPTLSLDRNIASPSNYYNGVQLEVKATSGTAGIGLHRNGFSHVGIYHDSTNVLKFDMNSGTVTINHNTGTVWGSGNDGSGSGLDADTLDGLHASSFLTSLPSHNHDDRYYTESESDARFQPLENQRVSTSSTVRFSNIYTTAWFRNDNSNTGMYNETTTMHWSSAANGYWDASSTNSTSGIRFYTGGHLSSIRGYLHSNSSNEIGFLNSGGNWSLRCDNSQNVHVTTAVYAPIYYDSANSNYYLNPNGYSNLGTVRFNSSGANAEVVAVDGVNGRLFTVTDDMTDSIFSVNTISGLPVIEAFANYKVVMGRYGQNDFIINENGQTSIGGVAQGSYELTVIGGQWGSYFRGGDSGTGSDIARFVDNTGTTRFLVRGDGAVLKDGNTVWHAGNDGSGSGLDADTLDGQHASAFLTSLPSHNHDDRYYTESESDSRYLYYRGISTTGDFQTFQSTGGVLRFDQVNASNNLTNRPPGYTFGGVLSMRGDNFGFQLWGSHTGDFVIKTQWNDDQYSGWASVITSLNIGSQSVSYAATAGTLSNNSTVSRDLYINGGAGSSFGNRLIVGGTSAPYTMEDGNNRPVIYSTGAYPVLTLNHTVTSNTSHGPTIQFTHNTLDKQWVIGSNGTGTQLDFGYSTNTNRNPHNGIDNLNGTTYLRITNGGNMSVAANLLPWANNTYNLGSASLGWANVYTNDLHLSNMNKPEGNDIDGTSGTWTIQEGAENLYIINNLNGKKYRITLEEI